MPDKQDNWAADEAFWDEGWIDMEQRLDRRKRRGILLPLFLGLLLLAVVGAGALVLGGSPDVSLPGSDPQASRETVTPSAPVTSAHDEPEVSVSPSGEESPVAERREATATKTEPRQNYPPSPAPAAAPPRQPETPTAPGPQDMQAVSRQAATAVRQIEVRGINFLITELDLPDMSLKVPDQPLVPAELNNRYTLMAGTSVYPTSFLPGAYAQVSRRWSWGEWFVPVAIRYDYGRLAFRRERLEEDFQMSPVSGPQPSYAYQVPDPGEQTLTTHTMALRSGGGWSRGRLTLSGGAEVGYLIGGRGPTYSAEDGGGTLRITVEQERFNGSYNYLSANNADLANLGGQPGLPSPTRLNRFLFNTWLRTDYRVSGSFHLSLGLTRGLTPLYRDDALRVEATRLELGLLYTIR